MMLNKELLNYCKNEKEEAVIRLRTKHLSSNRQVAEKTGVPRRTVDRIVKNVAERAAAGGAATSGAKILVLDIETAPMRGLLWSMWQNGISLNAIESQTYILTWSAKWVGEDEVYSDSLYDNPDYEPGTEDDSRILTTLGALIDEADFVVGHNSDNFDLKWIRGRMFLADLPPPSPTRQIDTLKIVKREFKFNSNKLENLLQMKYGIGKMDVGGMETWKGCMAGDADCWARMIEYNEIDVVRTEQLYLDIRHWDRSHPSVALHVEGDYNCVVCGSWNVTEVPNKYVYTNSAKYNLFRCECGHNMRGRQNLRTKEQRATTLLNAR